MVEVRFFIPRTSCCLLICFNDFLIIIFYTSFLLPLFFFLFLLFCFFPQTSFFFRKQLLLGHIFHEIKLSKFFLLLETRDETLAPQP